VTYNVDLAVLYMYITVLNFFKQVFRHKL